MTTLTLEMLGLDAEQLRALVVAEAVEQLLGSKDPGPLGVGTLTGAQVYPYEDFATRIIEIAKQRATERVNELGEAHVVPNVDAFISNLVLTQTNSWGEKKGPSLTFVEYLVERADAYMREIVNSDGESEADARRKGRSWSSHDSSFKQPRMAYMVDKYIRHAMEQAVKKILDGANSHIKGGIESAFKQALASVVQTFTVRIETKTP